MLTIKDIPQEAIDALEKAFYANDKIKALRDKYNWTLYSSYANRETY